MELLERQYVCIKFRGKQQDLLGFSTFGKLASVLVRKTFWTSPIALKNFHRLQKFWKGQCPPCNFFLATPLGPNIVYMIRLCRVYFQVIHSPLSLFYKTLVFSFQLVRHTTICSFFRRDNSLNDTTNHKPFYRKHFFCDEK
jgi:hypothetical protein